LRLNTTGSSNTAIGHQALDANTTGSFNTCIGYQAGYSLNGSGNTLNTFIGQSAGYNITSGIKNTIIGTYNGNQNGLDIRTASNYIVLSDGDGTPRGFFNGQRFVIGTSTLQLINEGSLAVESTGNTATFKTNAGSGGQGILCWNSGGGTAGQVKFFTGTSYTEVGSITSTSSVTTYNTSSDYRLKNITGALTGYKERIMSLLPKQGTWIADASEFRGFVAHDFANQYPNSVVGKKDAVDAEGKPIMQAMQASSSEVMADLVAIVKELITENASLKARLDAANL